MYLSIHYKLETYSSVHQVLIKKVLHINEHDMQSSQLLLALQRFGVFYSLLLPVIDTCQFILYGNPSARGGTNARHMEMIYPGTEDSADNAIWCLVAYEIQKSKSFIKTASLGTELGFEISFFVHFYY